MVLFPIKFPRGISVRTIKCKGFWHKEKKVLLKNVILKWKNHSNIEILPKSVNVRADIEADYIVPPFFDAHSHLFLSGSAYIPQREKELNSSHIDAFKRIEEHIEANLKAGICGVRDAGDNMWCALKKRDSVENFKIAASGKAVFKKNRYGAFIGIPVEDKKSLIAVLQELEKKKIDIVKVLNSGVNSVKEFGKETSPQFTVNDLNEICAFARLNGLKVMVHANGKQAIKETLKSNIDTLEHCFFMGKNNMIKIIDKNIKIIPTFSAMNNLIKNPLFNNKEKNVIKKTVKYHIQEIKEFLEAGGKVCLGTDSGSFNVKHGDSFYQEVAFFSEKLKLSIENVLDIITNDNYAVSNVKRNFFPFLVNLRKFNLTSLIEKNFSIVKL